MSSFSSSAAHTHTVPQPAPDRSYCAMPIPRSSLGFYSLTGAESRRRLWHMTPGLLPIPLQFISHRDPLSPTLWWIILAVIAVLTAHIFLRFRRIRRNVADVGTSAITGYAAAVLLTIVALPDRLEVGLAVLAILAFGDGSASLFGQLLRGPVLPWNPGKSWSGLLAFLFVGGLLTAWIYWGETQNPEALEPALTFPQALLLTLPAVAACAFIESIPSRINDNIRVGFTAATCLALLSLCR